MVFFTVFISLLKFSICLQSLVTMFITITLNSLASRQLSCVLFSFLGRGGGVFLLYKTYSCVSSFWMFGFMQQVHQLCLLVLKKWPYLKVVLQVQGWNFPFVTGYGFLLWLDHSC